ncbi:MAG: efflux RND transporter periplasmic adaptor subunit [Terriglobia bacterium]
MSKTILEWTAAAIVAAAVTMVSSCSRPTIRAAGDTANASTVAAGVVKVERRDLSNELEIASEFIPYQEIDVHAKVSGYVKKLFINWGTHVNKGQLLAILSVPELDAQVLRDRAAVARDQEELARAREELGRSESAASVAHLTYSRLDGVIKTSPGLVAQEEVDVAHGKDLEAAAAVSAAKDALAAAGQQLGFDRSTLARDEALVDYSHITAPFDGVVTQLNAYTGSLLPAGTSGSMNDLPLCHLSQNDLLRLVIPVPSQVVPDVHVGEVVNVRVKSLHKVFQGKVARFSDQINLQTRTMHTEVEVPNSNYQLVPGMYASVQLPVESAKNALALPLQAVEINANNQGTILLVNPQNQIVERQVQLGLQTASEVQIVSGVHEGATVVFGELSRFHPGETVKPEPVNLASLGAMN